VAALPGVGETVERSSVDDAESIARCPRVRLFGLLDSRRRQRAQEGVADVVVGGEHSVECHPDGVVRSQAPRAGCALLENIEFQKRLAHLAHGGAD